MFDKEEAENLKCQYTYISSSSLLNRYYHHPIQKIHPTMAYFQNMHNPPSQFVFSHARLRNFLFSTPWKHPLQCLPMFLFAYYCCCLIVRDLKRDAGRVLLRTGGKE